MNLLQKNLHAFCIAAPRSGEGKTTIALALMRLLCSRGMDVRAFKCGPDYIDPTYHAKATGHPVYNLDTWMMDTEGVRSTWAYGIRHADVAICEGVMGLFDGHADTNGAGSTIDCARTLGIPVLLVVNAKGMGSSFAALVEGFYRQAKRAGVRIVGTIANNTGSPRHVAMLRRSLEQAGLPPLLGAFPRSEKWSLPERQLGLVPALEMNIDTAWLDALAAGAADAVAMEKLLALTLITHDSCAHEESSGRKLKEFSPLSASCSHIAVHAVQDISVPEKPRMGIARDKAFCFSYGANERALELQGWELVPFSPLSDTQLPNGLEAIYFPGGYPEVFAKELAANASLRRSVYDFAARNGNIYAECGGYIFLADTLVDAQGREWPMCGVINATAHMGSALRSLGYREAMLCADLPFANNATLLRGHEFHWSTMELHHSYPPLYTIGNEPAGVAFQGVRAGYLHLYWANGFSASSQNHTQVYEKCPEEALLPKGGLILFDGPSSVGKTTLSRLLQETLQQKNCRTLLLSADTFLRSFSPSCDSVKKAVEQGLPFTEIFHNLISHAVRTGMLVLVDHVAGERPEWLFDIEERLGELPSVHLSLSCSSQELERRESGRTDRTPDVTHAHRQSLAMQQIANNALQLDTEACSSEVCVANIIDFLYAHPLFSSLIQKKCTGEEHV